eukprot:2009031-Amphidinium_carterae.2
MLVCSPKSWCICAPQREIQQHVQPGATEVSLDVFFGQLFQENKITLNDSCAGSITSLYKEEPMHTSAGAKPERNAA